MSTTVTLKPGPGTALPDPAAPLPVVPRALLFSAVRNEGPFLPEWIAYHRAIGFERVVTVSNDCTDGTDLLLDALAAAGVVSHIANTVPQGERPQASAGKLGRKRKLLAPGDWALWLDADEFLNVHTGQGGLADLVAVLGPRRGMLIPWRIFGDGGNACFAGRHLSAAFTGAAPAGFAANREVKTLFRAGPGIAGFARYGINRPLLANGHALGPSDFLSASGRSLDPDSEWNLRWFKARDSGGTNLASTAEFGWDLAQINHYCIRTPEHFRLKHQRGRGYGRKGANRPRHTDDFYREMNRNDEQDRSILRHQARTDAELARLLALPGVAAAVAEVARRVREQLHALGLAEAPPPLAALSRPAPGAGSPPGAAPRAEPPAVAAAATARAQREAKVPPSPAAPAGRPPVSGSAVAAPAASTERRPPAPALPPARPELTFPAAEAARVRAGYAEAAVILEYGSGGSTVLASELPGRTVFSVESDADWCAGMQAWFDANPGRARVILHHADIDPTRRWGRPKGTAGLQGWPLYPLSVWDRPDFLHPDLVLIDGRFRPACFFATLFRISRAVTVLWDDYAGRPEYHHVESFAAPVALHGRMAEFHLAPQGMPGERLGQVVAAFLDPQ